MKTIFALVFGFLFSIQGFSQSNTITTAVPFLMITPDARAAGMGEVGVASSPDVNASHWNGAKSAFANKKFALGISYTPWMRALVTDIHHSYLSTYYKPDSVSAFTASARYFSMGTVTYTSATGTIIGQSKPYEFAIDFGYSRRIAKYWSVGMAGRYINSNLTNGITIANQPTYSGQAFAVDLSAYYLDRDRVTILDHPCVMMMGVALTNVGNKMKYTDSADGDFLPINLRIGQGFRVEFNLRNSLSLTYELNKLLVPSPPIYQLDTNGFPMQNSSGQYIIVAGKDPNVSVPQGMVQSFYDAPGGKREEFQEINFSIGMEYWYNNMFAARAGFFYESPEKGDKQYFTLGAGVKYKVFGLDLAYLIPTNGQRSPLQNTLRFSLLFEFSKSQSKK